MANIKRKNTPEELACLQNGVTTISYHKDGCIYIIENTISETRAREMGFFLSLGDAVDGIKKCCDWYRDFGTGNIYRVIPGVQPRRELVWHN